MELGSLLGTINNSIINIMDETGSFIINAKVIYDIPYIVKSLVLIVCLVYFFKGLITVIRMFGSIFAE